MIHRPTLTHIRRSSYRRRTWKHLARELLTVAALTGMLYAIFVLLGGYAR